MAAQMVNLWDFAVGSVWRRAHVGGGESGARAEGEWDLMAQLADGGALDAGDGAVSDVLWRVNLGGAAAEERMRAARVGPYSREGNLARTQVEGEHADLHRKIAFISRQQMLSVHLVFRPLLEEEPANGHGWSIETDDNVAILPR
jgi:hypothetical protein